MWDLRPEDDARRPVTKQLVNSLHVKIQVLEEEIASLKAQDLTQHEVQLAGDPNIYGSSVLNSSSTPQSPPGEMFSAGRSLPSLSPLITNHTTPSGTPTNVLEQLYIERLPLFTRILPNRPRYQYIFLINTSIPFEFLPEEAKLSLACNWSFNLPILDVPLSRFEHDTLLYRSFRYGTTYSDDSGIKSHVVREKFAAHAKRLLDDELGHLAPSLVQGLALLAEHYYGIGNKGAGYMYMGMSFRAARALNFLKDSTLVVGAGSITTPKSVINEWDFWSTFAQGRYDIPLPPPGVNLPAISVEVDNQHWPIGPDAVGFLDSQPNRMTQVFLESSKLMIIASRITDSIYCQGPSETFVPEDSTAINLHLPPELLISTHASLVPLPHVILINMCYWRVLMYLHQPFYQRSQPPNGLPTRDSHLFSAFSTKMCDHAAYKILQLAIFTCGTNLILQSATISETAVKRWAARQGVFTCICALRVISPTWPCVEKSKGGFEALLQAHIGQLLISPPMQSHLQANFMEQELDDRAFSEVFYRFIHEWKQGGSDSRSLTPQSPASLSQVPPIQLGDIPGNVLDHTPQEHAHFSGSSLSQGGLLDSYDFNGMSHYAE
ncbi:hypothetical protein BDV93DRAFT_579043 [Ceratobasidium sp. AG-I]|nr:hypothetical protein BDV93DRAFT_579043 [Ceratobasidium sp. AG-I]